MFKWSVWNIMCKATMKELARGEKFANKLADHLSKMGGDKSIHRVLYDGYDYQITIEKKNKVEDM